ncbi:MAG: 50S ribosomal protein L25/general stress protein Ctc [Beggiatoa sp. IS2]|nr:MAG: 50S ribosomal protein L25/general stress protein Ctc [Beggiatoa sp. IS2]
MQQFEIEAQVRTKIGKGTNRRLRRNGQIPAILYGAGKDPVSLVLSHNALLRQLENEAFYSHILTIKIDGQAERVVLKDLQRHPCNPVVLHLDLLRVSETEKLTIQVPLHFLNEEQCAGIKLGGIISRHVTDAEVRCLPKDLPEFIEVDLTNLKVGDIVHLSDLVMPAGTELLALVQGRNLAVASIHIPRAEQSEVGPEVVTEAVATPAPAPAKETK